MEALNPTPLVSDEYVHTDSSIPDRVKAIGPGDRPNGSVEVFCPQLFLVCVYVCIKVISHATAASCDTCHESITI